MNSGGSKNRNEMNSVDDAILREVMQFVPSKTFLPICHVSKRFRSVWLNDTNTTAGADADDDDGSGRNRKLPAVTTASNSDDEGDGDRKLPAELAAAKYPTAEDEDRKVAAVNVAIETASEADSPTDNAAGLRAVWACSDKNNGTCDGNSSNESDSAPSPRRRDKYLTSPMQLGNIFNCPWNRPSRKSLNTDLLAYYVEQGWTGRCKMKQVMTGAAARGDIEGMEFMFDKKLFPEDDAEICTIAAAAGQLEALRWLREIRNNPWNPTEVHRESSENLHDHVMDYVEQNSEGSEIQLAYGVGLPW